MRGARFGGRLHLLEILKCRRDSNGTAVAARRDRREACCVASTRGSAPRHHRLLQNLTRASPAVPAEPGRAVRVLVKQGTAGSKRIVTTPDTEKAKMLRGELYIADDPELVAERLRAQELLHIFNGTPPRALAERRRQLTALLDRMAEDSTLLPPFRCDYGYNISIGRRTFINYDCIFLDCNRITLGDDVQIAPRVQIYTATHPIDATARRAGPEYALPVSIGDGAWLGGGVILCPGVTIGSNTVIGAGSVVTRSIPPGVVAAGNPCRILRRCDRASPVPAMEAASGGN